MKVLVAYDGTIKSKEALMNGIETVRKSGGKLLALCVFKSPLFVDYDSIPGAEEVARKEARMHFDEAAKILRLSAKGIPTELFFEEGDPQDELLAYARDYNVDLLLCPPNYRSIIENFRKELAQKDDGTSGPNRSKMAVVSFQ